MFKHSLPTYDYLNLIRGYNGRKNTIARVNKARLLLSEVLLSDVVNWIAVLAVLEDELTEQFSRIIRNLENYACSGNVDPNADVVLVWSVFRGANESDSSLCAFIGGEQVCSRKNVYVRCAADGSGLPSGVTHVSRTRGVYSIHWNEEGKEVEFILPSPSLTA